MQQPTVIFDDDALVVIDKPAGWVVHEGAGETGETIADWFVKNYPEVTDHQWDDIARIGIVHRLDKDTSGIMVLAKSPAVLTHLQQQFQDRTTEKVYTALLYGVPKEQQGRIETFIGRHPKRRQEQAVLPIQVGERARREAITEYRVEDIFTLPAKGNQPDEFVTRITFYPKTGRMHQLRVHAKYLGTPILGDQVYNTKPSKRLSKNLGAGRQLLHALSLSFTHPTTAEQVNFTASLPKDIQAVLQTIS